MYELSSFETKSSYCRAKVEFNSINLVRHGSSTIFEMGLEVNELKLASEAIIIKKK